MSSLEKKCAPESDTYSYLICDTEYSGACGPVPKEAPISQDDICGFKSFINTTCADLVKFYADETKILCNITGKRGWKGFPPATLLSHIDKFAEKG